MLHVFFQINVSNYLAPNGVKVFGCSRDVFAVKRHYVVSQRAAEQFLDYPLKLRRHFLHLRQKVDEELRHIFLFTGIQWLVVHLVSLAERQRIVRLPLGLAQVGKHSLKLVKGGRIPTGITVVKAH